MTPIESIIPKKYAPPSPKNILPNGKFKINTANIAKNIATKKRLISRLDDDD